MESIPDRGKSREEALMLGTLRDQQEDLAKFRTMAVNWNIIKHYLGSIILFLKKFSYLCCGWWHMQCTYHSECWTLSLHNLYLDCPHRQKSAYPILSLMSCLADGFGDSGSTYLLCTLWQLESVDSLSKRDVNPHTHGEKEQLNSKLSFFTSTRNNVLCSHYALGSREEAEGNGRCKCKVYHSNFYVLLCLKSGKHNIQKHSNSI